MAIQAAPAVIARRDHCHDNGALAGLVGTCLVEVCEGTLALGPWGERPCTVARGAARCP